MMILEILFYFVNINNCIHLFIIFFLLNFLIVAPDRPFDSKNPFLAPVTVNRRLNKAGDRHLMHLELDITGSKIRRV